MSKETHVNYPQVNSVAGDACKSGPKNLTAFFIPPASYASTAGSMAFCAP